MLFAAAQAAQKSLRALTCRSLKFAAAQAAQKDLAWWRVWRDMFAAAQAAQKNARRASSTGMTFAAV